MKPLYIVMTILGAHESYTLFAGHLRAHNTISLLHDGQSGSGNHGNDKTALMPTENKQSLITEVLSEDKRPRATCGGRDTENKENGHCHTPVVNCIPQSVAKRKKISNNATPINTTTPTKVSPGRRSSKRRSSSNNCRLRGIDSYFSKN